MCALAPGLHTAAALFLVVLMCSTGAVAYSVLTHEEIVDLLWTSEIRPLLLNRYPGLTDDQIRQAMPMHTAGLSFRTSATILSEVRNSANLVHYVRSGDLFVSCCSKVRMQTSTLSPWALSPTTRPTLRGIRQSTNRSRLNIRSCEKSSEKSV